ncbi:MAG TPA: tetratricopeptide repeat protein [Candidatus Mcinerneyibacterium sp.]|nr:tetratricopeptide repeat protein [Candidatus Mcinerneyibacterium sp.]
MQRILSNFLVILLLFIPVILGCSQRININNSDKLEYASKITSLNLYDKAIKYYKEILKSKNIDNLLKAKIYNNLAVLYEMKGKNIKAKQFYRKALKLNIQDINEDILNNYKIFLKTI